jgi:hypothetical protein
MKKIYTLLLLLGIIQQSIFAQIENFEKIYIGNKINYGDFDFIDIINLNPCDYCPGEEQPLEDISFGYDIGAALTASALIQQARERALNQWFDRQHTVLKEEIERQLGQSFSNYNDARNTYFKFHERIGLQRNHTPIENKYNSRRLDKENKQSISLKNLKLLRLRENEIRDGNINNSSYGNFTYNGTSLDQIQSLSQLQNLWSNETNIFSDNNWKYQNDRRLYYTVRGLGGLQNYSHEIFTDLFNKQLAFYNQYDRWKQLDLMQAFLNEIRPPLALPAGYISPQTYSTSQYIEDYAISKHLNTWSADMIFHPYYYQHTTVYQIWMAREGRQEAIERATAYVQGLRNTEINNLLNEVEVDKILDELLTGKAKCLNNHLDKKGNSFVKNIFSKFEGESKFHINIKSKYRVFKNGVSSGGGVNGITRHIQGSNFINIEISTSKLSNMPALASARTLIHEYIHADMVRKIYTANYDGDLDFKTTYEKYETEKQHNAMADLYINSIRDALKSFHENVLVGDYNYLTNNGTNPLPNSFYEALAWQGLKDTNVKAYTDLPDTKKTELTNSLNTYYHSITKNCPN